MILNAFFLTQRAYRSYNENAPAGIFILLALAV